MKIERTRAQAFAETLRRDGAPAAANTAGAIEAKLRNTTDAYIVVPEAWIKQHGHASLVLQEFAANPSGSSFDGVYPTPPPRNAFTELPAFAPATSWDLDSTPPFIRSLSRFLGIRTPEVEAAIVMASLKHDIRYYYGGDHARKDETDRMFANDIKQYGALLGADSTHAAVVAGLDEFAVEARGGAPFQEHYSWSFGVPKENRGYAPLATGHKELIETHAEQQMRETVQKLSSDSFEFSAELQRILTPELRTKLKELATTLLKQQSAQP